MRAVVVLISVLWSQSTIAGDVDRLIGTWLSPDGKTRQEFVREFDGQWIRSKMWFMSPAGWKLVSQGAMYRKPGDDTWHGGVPNSRHSRRIA
jgi:hypothetical protein